MHSSIEETRSYPGVIAVCTAVTVIEGFNLIVFGSVVPMLLRDEALGVTEQQIGLIGGLVYIGAIVGSILAPAAAQRLGRKRVLIGGAGVFSLGSLLSAVALDPAMLGGARLLTGLGVGMALTSAMTVARNSCAARRASLAVTVTMAGIPLGGVVAALLAVPMLPAFGWRPMFLVGTATGIAVLIAVARTTIPTDTPQEVAGRQWSARRKVRVLFEGRGALFAAVIAVAAIANMVAWQGLNVWAAEAMVDLGYSLRAALLLTFVLTGAAVAGSLVAAWVADRRGSALVGTCTAACTVVGAAGMAVLPLSLAGTVACVALMGIGGHSTMNLVHATVADLYPLPARAAALGWSNATSFVGSCAGPIVGGAVIASGGASGVFAAFAVAAVVCAGAVGGLWLAGQRWGAAASTPHADPLAAVAA